MEKKNKHWRIDQRNRIYAAQMKLQAAYGSYYFIINGERVRNLRWIDLYKANYDPVYKSVRTPCSCWMCRGESYNRRTYKKETLRILNESMY
jgi:hypothetical protein